MRLLTASETLAERRRHLVLIRASRRALHLQWQLPEERSWDLVTLAYDEALLNVEVPGTVGDWLVDNRAEPSKFFGMASFFEQHPEAAGYEAVMMPCDDLLFDPATLDELFGLMHRSGAAYAQPALTWDSYYSHFVTFQNPAFRYRYTNFAEVMAPMMSNALLRDLLPTFRACRSSWGLDFLWSRFCRDTGRRISIIDQCPVKHTRPVASAGTYEAMGINPHAEMQALMARFNISPEPCVVYGGVPDERFGLPRSGHLVESLVAGWDADMLSKSGAAALVSTSMPHLLVAADTELRAAA